jgi:hypothetical protein
MAIPFLNNINLDDNQLLNAKLHVTSSTPAAEKGQIYFDSTQTPDVIDTAKYYDGSAWISLIQHTYNNGTFINLTEAGTDATRTLTADLSATGTPDATVYLRGDNTWSPISGIPGTYTFKASSNSGIETVDSGDTLEISGGTYITGSVSKLGTDITNTLDHDSTSRSDTTSTDAPGYGGTFEAVTSVTTNATGHVTAIDVSTVTIPSAENYSWDVSDGTNTDTVGSGFELIFAGTGGTTTSYNSGSRTLTIDSGNETITLTGEVTGSGTTSISTTVANDVLDVANFNASAIVIESEGIENNDNDTTLPTSAAVKAYVDAATVGGLVYQGGYDANLNIPDLTTSPNSILKGWTYTVTADGTFFGEQLRVGDVLIAEQDDPSALADWTTVQNNIDLASLTQVGIGNVNPGEAIDVSYSNGTATVSAEDSLASNKGVIIVSKETNAEYRGIYVNYDAPGEVSIGLDIDTIPEDATPPMGESVMVYNDEQTGENYSIQISDLLALASGQTSYADTITDTATITHNLGTKDVIIQLYDVTTDETVYADVDRISTTQATITFASTPTNSIRVLVQKIG